MKPANMNQFRRRRAREGGQTITLVLLALGLFLLGAVGIAVDVSNWWFHRQMAQGAADAACVAGAMDLLVSSEGGTWNNAFTPGTAFDCTAASGQTGASPCAYAALNGYNSVNSQFGNLVNVSFPASVPGVTPPPASLAPVAFIRVDVLDHVQTNFTGLLSGNRAQDIRTFATCGVVLANAPIPIIVLHPTLSSSLQESGTPDINILGGPTKSVQVNSVNSGAVTLKGTAQIDLSQGGPNFSGSDFGVYGGPTSNPGGVLVGSTGNYLSPAAPVGDPYAQTVTPAQPPPPAAITSPVTCSSVDIQGGNCKVTYHVEGCPDPDTKNLCTLYTAGYYPNGIAVKNTTAIFEPGLYYLNGGLALQANSMVRPATGAGDGSQGTVFYLTGTPQTPGCSGQVGLVCVGSNSGKSGLDAFDRSNVQCSGGPAPDPRLNLPATLPGNVLLAPCTGTYGDPLGKYRGILFFQDRSSDAGGGWGGGGGFLLAGSMYFHMCNATGTGTNCSKTVCTNIGSCPAGSSYGSNFSLQGNSGSTSYVLGDIVADTLTMGGTPSINMSLNPNAVYSILKASLLQ